MTMCNEPFQELQGPRPLGIPHVLKQLESLASGEWTSSGNVGKATWSELAVIAAINRCIGNIEGIRNITEGKSLAGTERSSDQADRISLNLIDRTL